MPKAITASLTAQEMLLVLLYRTIPERRRSHVRRLLFEAWAHPPPEERDQNAARFRAACTQLGSDVGLDVFDSFVTEPDDES